MLFSCYPSSLESYSSKIDPWTPRLVPANDTVPLPSLEGTQDPFQSLCVPSPISCTPSPVSGEGMVRFSPLQNVSI